MIPHQENIIQMTNSDSRFYIDSITGEFRPSVTYVQSVGYPTPIHLQKWKAKLGWEGAEEAKNKAGEAGSVIHQSIEQLLTGLPVETKFMSLKEKRSIQAFLDWYAEEEPEIIRYEYKIWADSYAGTVDLLCRLKRDGYTETWLVDYKSGGIYDTGKSQIMAYKKADPEATRCAILQLGNTTKKRYTFSKIKIEDEDFYWLLFLQCQSFYNILRPNDQPPEGYPEIFMLPQVKVLLPTYQTI